MSLETVRECGRKAFAQKSLPATTKTSSLHWVMLEAMHLIKFDPIAATKADIQVACQTAFDTKAQKMLPFEADSERRRMTFLIERWADWEKHTADWILLASDLTQTVSFAGADHHVKIDILVRRHDCIEAIRFRYSAPRMKYNGRVKDTMPSKNPELLLLQTAGEQAVLSLKCNPQNVPIYASFYHMKGKKDTARELKLEYDDTPGTNIITHSFSQSERKQLNNEFSSKQADPAMLSCDIKTCRDCTCNDLCYAEFVPHKLEEAPDTELKKIHDISLTPSQQEFVNFDDGILRVNAVAGSGKTTVVTLRTIALIEEGADPEKILMVTFTDKAKNEMKQRLKAYAEGDALKAENLPVEKVQIETFNSWGQKTIEQYYDKLGFTVSPVLVDDVIKKDIIVQLLEAHQNLPLDYRNPFMNTMSAQGAVTTMVSIIDTLKANHVESVNDVMSVVSRYSSYASELLDMYQEYNAALVNLNMLDYEDQLRLLLQLQSLGIFSTLPYEHVVVDEFQDSNKNQIDIIVQLVQNCKTIRSLVVVGDELQAIYGFRNATPENLVEFGQYFPHMEDIPLADNFRSETPIISLANHIISQTARIPKIIQSHNTAAGLPPAVIAIDAVSAEQKLFTKQIQKLIQKDGMAPSDIAVLTKTRAELIKYQEAFDKAGIPTVLRVPKIIGDEPYVKAIISLAHFFKDSNNMQDFALYAKSLGQDPFDINTLQASAKAVTNGLAQFSTEAAKISYFLQLIDHCRQDYVADSFITSMCAKGFHTLNNYLQYCMKYRLYNTKETISSSREDADCVSLITVHSAKGLEWDTVLLSLRGFRYSREEERLLYVGVTRAKKRLLVTYTDKQQAFMNLLYP